jgi:hypothetical protein
MTFALSQLGPQHPMRRVYEGALRGSADLVVPPLRQVHWSRDYGYYLDSGLRLEQPAVAALAAAAELADP